MEISHTHTLIDDLVKITNQDPFICYQCGKCSAGCPIRSYMTEPPNQIVRFVQLGFYDRALCSKTPWLCAGCLTCSTRCPQNFDLAKFMDGVREIAFKQGKAPDDERTLAFHKAFIDQIKNFGRLYEMGLVMDYKLRTLQFFQDVLLAPVMLFKGKLGILPHTIKDRKNLKNIVEKLTR